MPALHFSPINNADLLDREGQLRKGIHGQYVLLPKQAHDLLASWHGVDGPALPREAVTQGKGDYAELKVDFYPLHFEAFLSTGPDSETDDIPGQQQAGAAAAKAAKAGPVYVSRAASVGTGTAKMAAAFGLPAPGSAIGASYRLW